MKFKSWVKSYSTTELAYKLKVTPQSIIGWSKGKNLPRGPLMIKLVKLGNGAFDFRDIVVECSSRK